MPRQPSPEYLPGSPPPGLKPFGLVTQQPSLSTPAGAAGLAAGDALLSFGEARHLRELQATLQASIGSPVVVLCVDIAGRYCRKYVVPAQWDPSAPKSLLGCQMSNQCPADHPAITGILAPPMVRHQPMQRPASGAAAVPIGPPRRTCCSRCLLVIVSTLQLAMVLAILGLPSVSPGAADLLRLARAECTAPATNSADSQRLRALAAHPEMKAGQLSAPEQTSGALDGEDAHGLKTLTTSGFGLLTIGGTGPVGVGQMLSNLQLHGQLDMDDMVMGILIACLVLGSISTLGLAVACSPSKSCAHRSASTLYFVTSLPVWVALAFVVAYCYVFRSEAEVMVRRYWKCLLLTEPQHKDGAVRTAWTAASAVYQSITLTASLLLACDLLLLAGLVFAGSVIGWGAIAANLMNVFNGGQLLVGGGLVAVAAGLHTRSDGSVHADAAMVALGFAVLAVSSVGLLGSRLHSRCLLQLYSTCSALITIALCAFVIGLSTLGVTGIADSSFVAANWHYVHEVYPISKDDFMMLLRRHWAKLMIASTLLTFVQIIVLCASCVLRRALYGARLESATYSEQASLMEEDDDESSDGDAAV